MRFLVALACALVPASAHAQWSLSTFTGANRTLPSTITIERPDAGMALEFLDVHYDAKPLISPPYYGARVARFFGERGRFGVEVEFLHIKVYARTQDVVHVRGTVAGAAIDARLPMNTFVERYHHTHGLNFLFGNLVWRQALGGVGARTSLQVRGGVGPVRPGRDVVMPGSLGVPALNVQGYEFAGLGAQAAAGLNIRLSTSLSALVEYKFTHARPELDLTAGGRGRMTANTHNIVFGITIGR
jgi:hypothetical protein